LLSTTARRGVARIVSRAAKRSLSTGWVNRTIGGGAACAAIRRSTRSLSATAVATAPPCGGSWPSDSSLCATKTWAAAGWARATA
jgi:hypothetical protein